MNMHHSEICNILFTIQDFFLLSDDRSNCELIPQPYYNTSKGYDLRIQQLCLRRKLASGWLEVVFHGLEKNSNLASCEYLTCLEPRTCEKSIEIEEGRYSIERVKDAIREILIMDKQPKSSSLDSIRSMEMHIQTSMSKPL
jgi:hypothetical protein